MKVLIVGSDKVYSIENYYLKYFRELGVVTECFTAQAYFYDYYYSGSVFRKLFFKLGLSKIFKKINTNFKTTVEQFQPQLIWIFKGMEIEPASIIWAKKRGIVVVNYNPDNPFIFTGKGSGNKNVTNAIGLYDYHFTYNLEIQQQLRDFQKAEVGFLPFGFDISDALYTKCSSEPEICKACFLGNPDKQRATFLLALAEKGVAIDVYGNNWNNFLGHENVTICPPVYGDELWAVLAKYRLQINIMRIHNENSHNMRTFEVPGIGGIQVAPYTNEHALFFKQDEEIFMYNNTTECVAIINYLLNLDYAQVATLRLKSRAAAVGNKHSYFDRAVFVVNTFKSLIAH